MKQSRLFYQTQRVAPKDDVSLNAQLLFRAGYIDKLMAGVYTLLPLGYRTYQKIEQIIREEMNLIGGQEMVMPSLHPKENWEKTGRWGKFDALIYLGLDEEKNLVLGPTHEEIISPLAKKVINSYKNLPLAVYQFQRKFRNEKRAKSGLLRLREFIMKDLYSFHANQEDLDQYYDRVKESYLRIFEKVGLGEKTFLTYASGGTFCKYSHEFQTLTEAGEDVVYICSKCRVAVNEEIIEKINHQCPQCQSNQLEKAKAIEVGNIFKLGTRFSQSFNLTYKNQFGQNQEVVMGCYGIGPERLMGAIVEVKNDSKGIIWPKNVAPYRLHLITLGSDEKVIKRARFLYDDLVSRGFEVLWDDRLEVTAGVKFAESDLMGLPFRVVISSKNVKEKGFEFKERQSDESKIVSESELAEILS